MKKKIVKNDCKTMVYIYIYINIKYNFYKVDKLLLFWLELNVF